MAREHDDDDRRVEHLAARVALDAPRSDDSVAIAQHELKAVGAVVVSSHLGRHVQARRRAPPGMERRDRLGEVVARRTFWRRRPFEVPCRRVVCASRAWPRKRQRRTRDRERRVRRARHACIVHPVPAEAHASIARPARSGAALLVPNHRARVSVDPAHAVCASRHRQDALDGADRTEVAPVWCDMAERR